MVRPGILLASILLSVCTCCETPFSYSLYDAHVPAVYRNLTCKNIQRLTSADSRSISYFKVALLADVHSNYDDLAAAIGHINSDDSILFSIIIGDLTNQGLLTEFLLLYDNLERLNKPYFTVIGNHDYLSNGGLIYSQMFGSKNYTFTFDSVKFVLFDDVFWESNGIPDFKWFENELGDETNFKALVPLAHIQPVDDQFPAEYKLLYHQLIVNAGASYSFHGHKHAYSDSMPFGDQVHYVTVASIQGRTFTELTIKNSSMSVRQIRF